MKTTEKYIKEYICDSCGTKHDNEESIHKCAFCGKEICFDDNTCKCTRRLEWFLNDNNLTSFKKLFKFNHVCEDCMNIILNKLKSVENDVTKWIEETKYKKENDND